MEPGITIVVTLALCASAGAIVFSEDAKPSIYNEMVCQLPDGSGGLCIAASDCPTPTPPKACVAQGLVCCPKASSPPPVAGVGLKSRQECEKSAQIGPMSECPPIEMISNKNVAVPGLFPYLASLGYGNINDNKWLCVGVLVSEYYVLTIARCLFTSRLGIVKRVRLGHINVTSARDDDEAVQDIDVDNLILHPFYQRRNRFFILGLLHLCTPAKLSPRVRPACLNPLPQLPTNHVIIAGFELVSDTSTETGTARYVDVTVKPISQCQQVPQYTRLGIKFNESLICAGDAAGGPDSCRGDSGGPLQIRLDEPHCQFSVAGLISFGPSSCGEHGLPSVYASVAHHLSWIESVVWS